MPGPRPRASPPTVHSHAHAAITVTRSLIRRQGAHLHATNRSTCVQSSNLWQAELPQLQHGQLHLAQQQQQQHGADTQPNVPYQQQLLLQQVLQINDKRFQALAERAPFLLNFTPHTLRVTVEALSDVLYSRKWAVCSIIELRPAILLAPYELVQTLQLLADVLGISSRHTAHLLSKNIQLLALSPLQLQQRLQTLCITLHWRTDSIQAAAAAAGTQAFLQLLAADPVQTQQQLTQLAAALEASEEACAAFAQHYPQQLLQQPHAATLMRQQLRVLAEAAGVSVGGLVAELEPDQSKGLAGLLLYEAGWIREQLRMLDALLETLLGRAVPGRTLVWLLLRLGTPDSFHTLHRPADTKACVATLQQACTAYGPWMEQLQQATDRELALLLTADAKVLQWLLFLGSAGRAVAVDVPLVQVVGWSKEEFEQQFGREEFATWEAQAA